MSNQDRSIDPELQKIKDFINKDTIFTIPEYQRAYSWGINNCDKMWQDIITFAESGAQDSYFFGTIILNCSDNKNDLIDGQQRTTTFFLLLKALLIKINEAIINAVDDDDSKALLKALKKRRDTIISMLYKIDPDEVSDTPNILEDQKIYSNAEQIHNKSNNERYPNELKNILSAVDFDSALSLVTKIPYKQKDNKFTNFFRNFKYFYLKVSDLQTDVLNNIAKTITDFCEVIVIKSWNFEQAINMFNSLNSDGLPLFDSDIIHAQLYAIAKKQNKENDFSEEWKKLLISVNEIESLGISNLDSILMQHMYYLRAFKQEIKGPTGAINVTTPGVRKYYTDPKNKVLIEPLELCNSLLNLVENWKKISSYTATKVLFKFNENSKLFLSSFLYRFRDELVTKEAIIPLLEDLLRLFSILELVDSGYSSSKFKIFLFEVSLKLVDKTVDLKEITEDFTNHIKKSWNQNELYEALLDYKGNSLVYLNEYLFAKENDSSFDFNSLYDIEHIMPNSGNNIQSIRNDAKIKDEDEFREIVNKLGNKILLEQKINRSIGNEWFRTKVSSSLKDKTGYVDSKCPLASWFVKKYMNINKPYWEKDDIEKATCEAAARIIRFIFLK